MSAVFASLLCRLGAAKLFTLWFLPVILQLQHIFVCGQYCCQATVTNIQYVVES